MANFQSNLYAGRQVSDVFFWCLFLVSIEFDNDCKRDNNDEIHSDKANCIIYSTIIILLQFNFLELLLPIL